MEGLYDQLYKRAVNYKVKRCCSFAPLRVGILFFAYFNIFYATLLAAGLVSETIQPLFTTIQDSLFEDSHSALTGLLFSIAEVGINVVLLCGMHRDDTKLLKAFIYAGLAYMGISVLKYALVMIDLSVMYLIVIVTSLVYQGYVIFLVHSAIVEIRQNKRQTNGKYPYSYSSSLGRRYNAETVIHYYKPVEAGNTIDRIIFDNTRSIEPKVEIVDEIQPPDNLKKIENKPVIDNKNEELPKQENKPENEPKTKGLFSKFAFTKSRDDKAKKTIEKDNSKKITADKESRDDKAKKTIEKDNTKKVTADKEIPKVHDNKKSSTDQAAVASTCEPKSNTQDTKRVIDKEVTVKVVIEKEADVKGNVVVVNEKEPNQEKKTENKPAEKLGPIAEEDSKNETDNEAPAPKKRGIFRRAKK